MRKYNTLKAGVVAAALSLTLSGAAQAQWGDVWSQNLAQQQREQDEQQRQQQRQLDELRAEQQRLRDEEYYNRSMDEYRRTQEENARALSRSMQDSARGYLPRN